MDGRRSLSGWKPSQESGASPNEPGNNPNVPWGGEIPDPVFGRERDADRRDAPVFGGNPGCAVRVKKLRPEALLPTYGTAGAAGADLYAAGEQLITIEAGTAAFVPTGLAFQIPVGYVGLVCARSGLATRQGLAPANKVGVIDCDYRGEVLVALFNHSRQNRTVVPGDRIAQLLVVPVLSPSFVEADELSDTDRGDRGFGSTGK